MPVALYDLLSARKLLLVQIVVMVLFSAICGLNGQKWALSAFLGGLSACLPSVAFLGLTWRHQNREHAEGKLDWAFFIGEIVKIIITIALLVIALAVFKAAFLPLCITYFAVLGMQILAPVLI